MAPAKTANAAPAKSEPARATKAAKATKAASATATTTATLRVGSSEKPWTAKELREIREELESERARALADLEIAEHDLQGLMRDAGEGAGDDQADAGASIFGREYEMSLVANSRDKLDQVEHALERLDNGTYGICESCGNPIGKMRLQAAPRATLCLACKTRQEHR
jgi:RNA polymerase-binding protein DksA